MRLSDQNLLRRLIATLIGGESILLFIGAIFLIVESFFADVKNYDALIAEIFFAVLGGLGLLSAARGIRRGHRYGNSPALLANLIMLAVSYYVFEGGWFVIALPLALLALLAIAGIIKLTSMTNKITEN